MKNYGLIGKRLGHSYSKLFFEAFWGNIGAQNHQYDLFELKEIEEILNYIETHNLSGFNITLPYKEAIIPFLDAISDHAKSIGAVNCVRIDRSSGKIQLSGDNTDLIALRKLFSIIQTPNHANALILGSGGAAKAVSFVLKEKNIPFKIVSRTPQKGQISYLGLEKKILADHQLIINCTPLGMAPKLRARPELDYNSLSADHIAIDLIYNPSLTWFLRSCQDAGVEQIYNGYQMLVEQALASWELWNNPSD